MIRWLTQPVAFGFCSSASSRAESITWRSRAVDRVAVRVDVGEVVVLAHGLELIEGRPQRPRVPQPSAGEGVGLIRDVLCGQDLVPLERLVLPAVEVERQPRHRDVVADVALFLGVLVRFDREALDRLRVEPADDQRCEEPDRDRQTERPEHPGEGATDQQRRGDPGDDGEDVVGEELGVLVGEADTGRDAPRAVHQVELVELIAEGHRQQEQPGQDAKVDADLGREDEAAARCSDQVLRAAR